MLEDLRQKKKVRKRVIPDDFFQSNGMSIARFGKFVVMENSMTPTQHKAIKKKCVEKYPEMCKEIDERVARIRKLVQGFNPLTLLQCGYFGCIRSMLGKVSESEYGFEDIAIARMLDYVQSVIVSTPDCCINQTSFNETAWNTLFEEVKGLYNALLPAFQIYRSAFLETTQKDYDIDYDKFYVQAQMLWLTVRCDRYFVYDMPHLHDLLIPHNQVFQELFGISVQIFLEGIKNIQFSLSQGLVKVVKEMSEFRDKVLAEVEKDKEKSLGKDHEKYLQQLIEDKELGNWHQSIGGRFLGFDLFDLQKITGLPVKLLDELSYKPGEDTSFFAEGEYAGWPLRLLPIMVRPFLCIKDRYYCFDLANLMDNLYRIIQRLIIRLKPDYQETWNSYQMEVSEDIPYRLFEKLLPSAKIYRNIFYKGITGTSQKADWCETDGLIIFDDHLIILEVKGGAFTYTPPTMDFDAYINSITDLVRKPALQARRFINYLNTSEEVMIYDKEYKPVATIKQKQFRHITACGITLDSFTELAARSDKLKPMGIEMPIPIWSISIDDLRVYADILDSPIVFTHFLEQRQKAANDPSIELLDEHDHLGLYLKHNLYVSYARETFKSLKPTYVNWYGYRKDLDVYYHNLLANPDKAQKPSQKEINGYFADIIKLLGKQEKDGRCRAGSYLLNMSGDARRNLNRMIEQALLKQSQKKRTMPISFIGDFELTIFCHSRDITIPSSQWMEDYTFSRMLIAEDETRMLLQIFFDEKNMPISVDFEFFSIKDIPSNRYEFIKQQAEDMAKGAIKRTLQDKKKIGRNDLCPCGSGKKYKRCCLR